MLLAYPHRMYQENWSLALERLLMMVGLSMQNLMANQPLAPHLGLSEVSGGVILPCNYIIRHLPSTYDQKLCLLRHTVSKTKAGSASRLCILVKMFISLVLIFLLRYSFQMFSIRLWYFIVILLECWHHSEILTS